MSAGGGVSKVKRNPGSMGSKLPKAKHWPACCVRGIHGAARARRGIKSGTHAAQRRYGKTLIREALEDL